MEGTQARGARSAAAAIKVATVTLVSFGAAAAASLAAYEGTEWDTLEPPRPARRARATFPGQPTHSRRLSQKLSAGPVHRESAREWWILGGKPLLVPHGGARTPPRGAHPHRCAALDACLAGFLCAAERVLLARAAGSFAPCALSLRIVLGSIDAYSLSCAR